MSDNSGIDNMQILRLASSFARQLHNTSTIDNQLPLIPLDRPQMLSIA